MPQLVPSAANRPESNAFHCQKDVHRQSFHFDTEDTGPAYTQVQIQPARRGPLDPLTTAVLDQPPGRAAKRLAPPGRLKRDLNKAHLHLGDLLPDPLFTVHKTVEESHYKQASKAFFLVISDRKARRQPRPVCGAPGGAGSRCEAPRISINLLSKCPLPLQAICALHTPSVSADCFSALHCPLPLCKLRFVKIRCVRPHGLDTWPAPTRDALNRS